MTDVWRRLNGVIRVGRQRTVERVVSGHSVIDHSSDRFTAKTGYSQMDSTNPSVKCRFRVG